MQEYQRETITNIINSINKNYFLPDIQRDFVWKDVQVYKLFDSLLRGYPIGTFLFWKLQGDFLESQQIKKLEFVKTSNESNKENTEIHKEREYSLVLDGQQRLTTFYLVLKGNYIVRNKPYDLYFNVLSGVEENDGVLYEFKFFNKEKGEAFLEPDKIENTKNLWYRVKSIYDTQDPEEMADEIKDKIISRFTVDLSKDQVRAIKKLHRMLTYEPIINYYPEKEKSYDRVLDIFVRTNSGGTQLSYSDLLFSTIKSQWFDARDEFKSLLKTINDNERYDFDHDFILKTILVVNAEDLEGIRYKTKNFGKDLISLIKQENYWKKFSSALNLSVDLLKDRFLLTHHKVVTSNNALIPIIYAIFKNNIKGFGAEKGCLNDNEISKMRIWFTKALLSGVFAGQSDSILFKCKTTIDDHHEIFSADKIELTLKSQTKKSMEISWDQLKNIQYNDKNSHLLLSICYKSAVNFTPRMQGNLPEQDHIFSQAQLKSAKISEEKINSIFNIRYIGSGENKIKSDNKFEEWMKSIGRDARELEKHLIPAGKWNVDNYGDFLMKRKQLFIKKFQY